MSPFLLDLSFKQRHRRLISTAHVRYPANAQPLVVPVKRAGDPNAENHIDNYGDIFNKWWFLFVLGIVIVAAIAVIVFLAIFKYFMKRSENKSSKSKAAVKEKKDMNEKDAATKAVKPIILHLGMRPEPTAPGLDANTASPNILITPATASPSKLAFTHHNNDVLDYGAHELEVDYHLKKGGNDESPRLSTESVPVSDFNGSEADIAHAQIGHVRANPQAMAHQLSLYHDQDFSHAYASPEESYGEPLDEIDLKSPGELTICNNSPRPISPMESDASGAVKTLASRVAAMVAKRTAQKSSSPPAAPSKEAKARSSSESDYETRSASGTSEHGLTESELGTLTLQFPPAAYPSHVNARSSSPSAGNRNKTLPLRYQERLDGNNSEEDQQMKYPVSQFAFSSPTMQQKYPTAPRSPSRAVNAHTASPSASMEPRPRSWSPPGPPAQLRRPFELSRVASHQDLHDAKEPPLTSYPRFVRSSPSEDNMKVNLSSQTRARVHGRTHGISSSGRSSPISRERSPRPTSRTKTTNVSDRYATRHLAKETVMIPRKSDLSRDVEATREEEMRSFT